MKKLKAKNLFEQALHFSQEFYPQDIKWAKGISSDTFKYLKCKNFLTEYCWAIYASGFKAQIIQDKFYYLQKAFKNFDLMAINRMRSLRNVLSIFNNERKAESFLIGSKMIADEGFTNFKKRLLIEGVDALEELPGIGPITKYHLAKNIGLVDAAKPDIWLKRAAKLCNTDVDGLVSYLAKEYSLTLNTVDLVLWRYCANNKLGL